LTNVILDVSRIESNTFKLQKDKVDLKQLVTESIEDTILKLQEGKRASVNIVLDSKLPKEVREISIDRGRINQVMLNVLDNAVNFTDRGKITVVIEQSERAPGSVEVREVDE